MDTLLRRRQMMSGGSQPAPLYTSVEYIETDGAAYINTGIVGSPGKSAEIKCRPVSASSVMSLLGSRGNTNTSDSKRFIMFRQTSSNLLGLSYYQNYSSGMPSVVTSVNDGTPFEAKTSMVRSSQSIGVKQEGESSFTTVSKADNNTVSSTLEMFLFAVNNNGTAAEIMKSGTRLYYCKIYGDATFSTLVFNGVPCYYNGEYGLWDKVSDTFFGAASGSGTFTGPQI